MCLCLVTYQLVPFSFLYFYFYSFTFEMLYIEDIHTLLTYLESRHSHPHYASEVRDVVLDKRDVEGYDLKQGFSDLDIQAINIHIILNFGLTITT